jgi:hypothetical protein
LSGVLLRFRQKEEEGRGGKRRRRKGRAGEERGEKRREGENIKSYST